MSINPISNLNCILEEPMSQITQAFAQRMIQENDTTVLGAQAQATRGYFCQKTKHYDPAASHYICAQALFKRHNTSSDLSPYINKMQLKLSASKVEGIDRADIYQQICTGYASGAFGRISFKQAQKYFNKAFDLRLQEQAFQDLSNAKNDVERNDDKELLETRGQKRSADDLIIDPTETFSPYSSKQKVEE